MKKCISYMMNTIVNPETIGEMWNIVSDADFCQFCVPRGDDEFFFFELNITKLRNEGNEYVKRLSSEEYTEFDTDSFIEDYITGVQECVELFNNDDNWNSKLIVLNDKVNDIEWLIDKAACLIGPFDSKDMAEEWNLETLRYMAAKELFYRWSDGEDIED